MEAAVTGSTAPGAIGALITAISPVVEEVRGQPGDLRHNAVIANINTSVRKLKTSSPIIGSMVGDGKITTIGAVYDLDTGVVEIVSNDEGD